MNWTAYARSVAGTAYHVEVRDNLLLDGTAHVAVLHYTPDSNPEVLWHEHVSIADEPGPPIKHLRDQAQGRAAFLLTGCVAEARGVAINAASDAAQAARKARRTMDSAEIIADMDALEKIERRILDRAILMENAP